MALSDPLGVTYEEACAEFEWSDAWDAFDGTPDRFNMGHEMAGKHDGVDEVAIRIVDFDGGSDEKLTYTDIRTRGAQFANFLDDLGLEHGDRVAAMMEPMGSLYATIIGTLLGGYVYVPLYTLFGPEALMYRLENSETKVFVTTPEHREKIDPEALESLEQVVVVDSDGTDTPLSAIDGYETTYDAAKTTAADVCALQYTSGTTGDPKGVEMYHGALASLYPYAKYAADIRDDDVFFGPAPPAWSYGLFYCTAVPLHQRTELVTIRGAFDPVAFFEAIETYEVTNLFAPPTAFRQLAQLDLDTDDASFDVRRIYSGGESVGASVVKWAEETFGTPPLEHYGFTEGGMLVNNYPLRGWELKPGSMGRPIPGREVELLDLDADEPVDVGETGEIAVRIPDDESTDFPTFAESYYGMPEKSERKFGGEWLRSDDLARKDEDGYFWYVSRADDVIISAGYRIGPSEVEDSILEHDAVAEVGVVGLPDDERGQIVAAFVVPAAGIEPSEELADDIRTDVRSRLSKHEYPRRVEFVDELPKTASGKIQRYRLEAAYGDG